MVFGVTARYFVLATGGIENARLLLSSNRQINDGIGDQFGHVGRWFMEHPDVVSGAAYLAGPREELAAYRVSDANGMRQRRPLTYSPTACAQQEQRMLNTCLELVWPRNRPAFRSESSGSSGRYTKISFID